MSVVTSSGVVLSAVGSDVAMESVVASMVGASVVATSVTVCPYVQCNNYICFNLPMFAQR